MYWFSLANVPTLTLGLATDPEFPKIPPDATPLRKPPERPDKSIASRRSRCSGVKRANASSLSFCRLSALAMASSGVMPKFSKEKGLPRSGPTLALRCPSSVLANQLLYSSPMLIAGVGVVSSST